MLYMHFPPGARGDFLGGLLLDRISERDNYAIQQPPKTSYTKVHHTNDFSFLKESGVKIRIDHSFNATNLVTIAANHLQKNKLEKLDDELDHMYLYIKDIIDRDSEIYKHRNEYDYWIDFSFLSNAHFLKDLYILVNQTTPDEDLWDNALKNINRQTTLSNSCIKLTQLLNFEITMGLLGTKRNFTISEFVSEEDTSRLILSNYQRSI